MPLEEAAARAQTPNNPNASAAASATSDMCMLRGEVMALTANTYKDPDRRPMVDSGATHGITNDRSLLKDIVPVSIKLRGVMAVEHITEKGTYVGIKGAGLKDMLLFENAPRTVVAVKQIRAAYPGKVMMGENIKHVGLDGKETVLGPQADNGWYRAHPYSLWPSIACSGRDAAD